MKYPETVSPSRPRTTVNEHSVIAEPYITISRHPGGSWGEYPCPLWPFPSSKISHVPSELKCNTFLVKMSFVCMWLVSIAWHLTSHWVSNSEIWFVGNLWETITWQSPKNNCVGSYSELACFGHCWFLYHEHLFYFRIWRRWYTVKTQWELSITSTSYGDPDGVGLFNKCPFAENFEEYLKF